MTESIRPVGALALFATLVLAACGSPGASASPSTVVVDGSSTVFPITEAVAEDFQLANPGARVTVAEAGTGGGFKKFCIGETDINDASRPIKKDDAAEGAACAANGIEYVELQIAIDGLTVVVNPANTWANCLTLDHLKAIYGPDSAENLTWDQVDPSFPNQPVVRFMPGADSGTFDYFTEAVNGEVDLSTSFATQSEDDNVLVTGVAGDTNAISYFGYAYYVQNTDKLKAIEVDGGSGCIAPTDATIGNGTYAPLSRPLFIYPDTGKAKASPVLDAFVDYYLANAGALAAEVGYIAVPDGISQAARSAWDAAVSQ